MLLIVLSVLGYFELHCPDGRSLAHYSGNVSVTDGGRTCEKWNVDDNETSESDNYCKNKQGPIPWCWISYELLESQGCAERICGGT